MRNSLPVGYPSGNCILLAIDRDLVPIVAGVLYPLTTPRLWDQASYQAGYYAITEVLAQMTTQCLSDLVQEIRDARGVLPDFVSTPIPDRTSDMYRSFNDLIQSALDMRGIRSSGWFSNTYTTLTDLLAGEQGTEKTSGTNLLDEVKTLMDESSDVSTVIQTISGWLGAEETTIVQGGLLLALIAVESANAQLLANIALNNAAAAADMAQVLAALRGATAPTDNILEALRGTTAADGTRNVVDLLS